MTSGLITLILMASLVADGKIVGAILPELAAKRDQKTLSFFFDREALANRALGQRQPLPQNPSKPSRQTIPRLVHEEQLVPGHISIDDLAAAWVVARRSFIDALWAGSFDEVPPAGMKIRSWQPENPSQETEGPSLVKVMLPHGEVGYSVFLPVSAAFRMA